MYKQLNGFSQKYCILEDGRIYSFFSKRILKYTIDKDGYAVIRLRPKGNFVVKNLFVHRLVAELFLSNPNKYPQVNHINGDKLNNHYSNLEWCNNEYNQRHRRPFLKKAKSKELYIHFKSSNNKWYVSLPLNKGVRKFIGYFNTEKEAIRAKNKELCM